MRNWMNLIEAVETIQNEEGELVQVWRNPSRAQLANLFATKWQYGARAIVDQAGDFFVWDSGGGVHDEIAAALGITLAMGVYAYRDGIGAKYDLDNWGKEFPEGAELPGTTAFIRQNRNIVRCYGPDVRAEFVLDGG